jgi:hypothetical protein
MLGLKQDTRRDLVPEWAVALASVQALFRGRAPVPPIHPKRKLTVLRYQMLP